MRTHRINDVIVFMAMIYYSEGIQNQPRENVHEGKVQRKPNSSFQESTLGGSL